MQLASNRDANILENNYKQIFQNYAESLQNNPSPEIRAIIADAVSTYFKNEIFDTTEKNVACEIIRLLAMDVSAHVRQAIAFNLKHSAALPRDIAIIMASDILEVAMPILESSAALMEEDIVTIIKNTKFTAKLIAISKRQDISKAVIDELLATKNEEVITSLLSNKSVTICESQIGVMLNYISPQLRSELINKYHLNKPNQEHSPEPTILPQFIEKSQTEQMVDYLFREGRLTESLILRALCEGNILFFEISIARRAGIPVINAKMLIRSSNAASLKSLWKRARMPESAFDAVNIIITLIISHLQNSRAEKSLSNYLLENIKEYNYDESVTLMPYFMTIIASGIKIKDIV